MDQDPAHHQPDESGLSPGTVIGDLRVFIDLDRTPPNVITAYRTTKFRKDGSTPP